MDTLIGGAGNDVYNADSDDKVIEYAGGGSDLIVSASAVDLTGMAVEDIKFTGGTAVTGNGNELNNKITANSGSSNLFGQDGNDTLIGGSSGNVLSGGAGNDSMAGGDGNDLYVVDSAGDKVNETGIKDSGIRRGAKRDQLCPGREHRGS